MMKTIRLKVTTPERVVLEKDAKQVTLTTEVGEITILPDHVPLLSIVVPGTIEVQEKDENTVMATSGGFLEFHDNEVTILADTAERADEIDLERAQKARELAEDLKKNKRMHDDEEQFSMVVSRIDKQLARIKVVKKYRPKGLGNTAISKD